MHKQFGHPVSYLRRVLLRVIASVIRITTRITNQLLNEITKNLQKFIAGRSQKRTKRPKPHKSHA
jgi:hypothetical protein